MKKILLLLLICFSIISKSYSFIIRDSEIESVEIYSMIGKLILTFDEIHSNTCTLSVTSLQKGVYIVRIIDKTGKQQSNKLINK